ncbi:phage terminase small subunit [Promicromonospora sukumoe]
MGMKPGPSPKRSTQRRRRNKPDESATAPLVVATVRGTRVKPPSEDRTWHPIAKGWYRSLKESGESAFFEPSDWQAARLCAYAMTRMLREHEDNKTPLRAGMLDTIWSMMGDLLTTETSRRRARIELERAATDAESDPAVPATVTIMNQYRDQLGVDDVGVGS